MTVTEKDKGTMSEAEEQAKVASKAEGKIPESEKVSSEEQPIYSQKQHEELVHAAKSEQGRKLKEVESERNTLKSQIQNKETQLEDVQAEIETLEQKLEDMSSDDIARFDAVKELKAARDERRQLKTKISSLDGREQSLAEREKKVASFDLEVLIETVADEYEGGEKSRLEKALSVFEKPTEEQIRNVADVIFTKKAEGEKEPPTALKVYSGQGMGGGDNIGSMSPKDRVQEADRRLRTQ